MSSHPSLYRIDTIFEDGVMLLADPDAPPSDLPGYVLGCPHFRRRSGDSTRGGINTDREIRDPFECPIRLSDAFLKDLSGIFQRLTVDPGELLGELAVRARLASVLHRETAAYPEGALRAISHYVLLQTLIADFSAALSEDRLTLHFKSLLFNEIMRLKSAMGGVIASLRKQVRAL